MMIRARSLGLKELQPAICVAVVSCSRLGLGIVCRSSGNTADMAGMSYIRTEQLICISKGPRGPPFPSESTWYSIYLVLACHACL
jgi:hypothetical protein